MVSPADAWSLQSELDSIAADFSGRVGYAIADLDSGDRLVRAESEWFPTASAIKLPVLTVLHGFVASGELSWSERLEVGADAEPGGSGVLQYLDRPRDISLRDAAWLMICLSDNLATNLVLERVGFDRAARYVRALVDDGLELDKPAGRSVGERAPTRSMGRATPAALLHYLIRLTRQDYAGSAETLAVAAQQQSRSGLARYLPIDSMPDPIDPVGLALSRHVVHVANKSGALPGIRTDVGIVSTGRRRIAIAALTEHSTDLGYGVEHDGERCIGALSRAVCAAWLGVER